MWRILGYCLLGLLALLVLLLLFPVSVRIRYQEEFLARIRVFGIPVYRFSPENGRNKSKKHSQSTGKKKNAKASRHSTKNGFFADLASDLKQDGVAAVLNKLKALVKLAAGASGRILKSITVGRLQLQLFIASEDAATTAVRTGQVCALLYPSLSALQSVLTIRRRAVTVTPDYLVEKSRAVIDVRMRVVPIRLLWVALWTVLKLGSVADVDVTRKTKEEQKHGK